MQAWHVSDLDPRKLFVHQESAESSEFIKVSRPTALAPVSFTITQQQGPIKIKGWEKDGIFLKISRKGSKEALANTTVTIDKSKLPQELSCTVVKKDENGPVAEVTFNAKVPFSCNAAASSRRGMIRTKRITGAQNLSTENGPISIMLEKFTIDSSIFAQSAYGNISVQAPQKIQANLSATTWRGSVTSELPVTLRPQTTLLNNDFWKRMKQEAHGMLGEGGAPITLETEHGHIALLKLAK